MNGTARRAAVIAGVLAMTTAATPAAQAGKKEQEGRGQAPLVIAHRGASAYRPEHTLAGYRLGDRDGRRLHRARPRLDQGRRARRPPRERDRRDHRRRQPPRVRRPPPTKVIDGTPLTGWFTEDFTLAELKTLRAKERIPQIRPANTAFDGEYEIPTLQEVIDLAKAEGASGSTPRPSTRRTSTRSGCSLEEPLVATLKANGLDKPSSKVFIQSFEVSNLRQLDTMIRVPLVQLDLRERPSRSTTRAPTPRSPRPSGLRDVARYADGLGPDKNQIVPRDAQNRLKAPTALVADAHRAGLVVHPYTFRPENTFLPEDFREGDPAEPGVPARPRRPAGRAGALLPPRRRRRVRRQRRHRRGRPGEPLRPVADSSRDPRPGGGPVHVLATGRSGSAPTVGGDGVRGTAGGRPGRAAGLPALGAAARRRRGRRAGRARRRGRRPRLELVAARRLRLRARRVVAPDRRRPGDRADRRGARGQRRGSATRRSSAGSRRWRCSRATAARAGSTPTPSTRSPPARSATPPTAPSCSAPRAS